MHSRITVMLLNDTIAKNKATLLRVAGFDAHAATTFSDNGKGRIVVIDSTLTAVSEKLKDDVEVLEIIEND